MPTELKVWNIVISTNSSTHKISFFPVTPNHKSQKVFIALVISIDACGSLSQQGALVAKGPQWVQGKALVGTKGAGKASWKLRNFR